MLVGNANPDVAGSKRLVAARSCGKSTSAWWSKTRPWVGLAVPDVVGVVYVVPSGSDVMPEGGGSAGTMVLAGGRDTLVLRVMEFEVGMLVIWGGSRGTWGSLSLQEVCTSPCVLPSPSYLGSLGLPAWLPNPMYVSHWGLCSLPLGLHSSVSSLTLQPSLLALAITADSGDMTSVIDVVMTLAVMGAAEMGLDGVGFTVSEGALWDDVGTRMGLIGGIGGLLGGSIMLELEDKVVGCNLAALDVVLLMNVAIVGLGGIGLSLGMAGALLVGWEFVVGGSKCRDASSHSITVGIIVAVQKVGGGTSSKINGGALSHLT